MTSSDTSLIITSISSPNVAMKLFSKGCIKNKIDFIVIGDSKSPEDFEIEGCRFISVKEQQKLPFKLVKLIPLKKYSRKNIGYLISKNKECIIETDDDNFPKENFWGKREKSHLVSLITQKGWFNIYTFFTKEMIWPRGLPLEEIRKKNIKIQKSKPKMRICPIQQGLADDNPDVDAVYRLTHETSLRFDQGKKVVLSDGTWSPFNSQNTIWFKEAFPLMYLPSYCSFRMTDIWRSFIAQRIAWECGWNILFLSPTVYQERNEHYLLYDFVDEIPGYINNFRICKMLGDLKLKKGKENILENFVSCYKMMIEEGFVEKEEMKLVKAWCEEFK